MTALNLVKITLSLKTLKCQTFKLIGNNGTPVSNLNVSNHIILIKLPCMSLIMKKHLVCNYDSSMDFAGVTVQITFTYESTQCALVFQTTGT